MIARAVTPGKGTGPWHKAGCDPEGPQLLQGHGLQCLQPAPEAASPPELLWVGLWVIPAVR